MERLEFDLDRHELDLDRILFDSLRPKEDFNLLVDFEDECFRYFFSFFFLEFDL